jgi:hypothetical protein
MPSLFHRWRDRRRERSAAEIAADRAGLVADYRFVFASEAGQRVLADLLRRAGVLAHAYDAHPHNHAYAEGKRAIGLELIEMINADPAAHDGLARTGETEELYRYE